MARYAGLRWWGPLSDDQVAALLGAPPARAPGGHAVDLACGRGALALWLARRAGMAVTAVDCSRAALDLLAADAAGLPITPTCADAVRWRPPAPVDLVGWLGGPPLGDSLAASLATLAGWLAPGGRLLVGLLHWTAPPPADWTAATGIDRAALPDADGLAAAVAAAGLVVEGRVAASRADWDHFEGTVAANLRAAPPDTPGRAPRLAFLDAQQRWGRDCLGHALLRLARAPGAPLSAAPR